MGAFAVTQAASPVVTQLAALTGSWGVEFLLVLVPAGIAAASAKRVRTGIATALVVVAALGYGVVRLAEPEPPSTRVAVLARSDNTWATNLGSPAGQDVLESYVDRLGRLPAGVRLAVLPEAVFNIDGAS